MKSKFLLFLLLASFLFSILIQATRLQSKIKRPSLNGLVTQIQTGRLPKLSLLERLDQEGRRTLQNQENEDFEPVITDERWIGRKSTFFPRLKQQPQAETNKPKKGLFANIVNQAQNSKTDTKTSTTVDNSNNNNDKNVNNEGANNDKSASQDSDSPDVKKFL